MELPEGFSIRPASVDDVPGIAAALAASDIDAYGTPDSDESDVKEDWAYRGFDLARDTFVVTRPDGDVAGYAAVFQKQPGQVLEAYGTVHPADRGQGIGRRLLELVEERARAYVAEEGADRVVLQQWVIGPDADGHELFSTAGYRVVRHTWQMAIDVDGELREFPCPEGVVVRTLQVGEERAVHAAVEEAFHDHWQFAPDPYEVWFKRTVESSDTFDPELWLLASDGSRLVGLSLSGAHVGEGYVGELGVVPEWRGRGLGAHLLSRSFVLLKQKGFSRVTLHVDAQNPTGATRLYKRVGMTAEREYALYGRDITPPA